MKRRTFLKGAILALSALGLPSGLLACVADDLSRISGQPFYVNPDLFDVVKLSYPLSQRFEYRSLSDAGHENLIFKGPPMIPHDSWKRLNVTYDQFYCL